MRHGRAAKQCIRLGAIGHFCGCYRRLTNPNYNSRSYCNSYSYCNSNTYTNGNADSDANTDANCNANCNANRDDHTGTNCETYAAPAAASYLAAEAIRRDFRAIS